MRSGPHNDRMEYGQHETALWLLVATAADGKPIAAGKLLVH